MSTTISGTIHEVEYSLFRSSQYATIDEARSLGGTTGGTVYGYPAFRDVLHALSTTCELMSHGASADDLIIEMEINSVPITAMPLANAAAYLDLLAS